MKKLIGREYDPVLGFETRYFYNEADGKIHVQRLQDVETNFDTNKAEYNSHGDHARFAQGHNHKMASIPMAVYEKWLKEGFDVLGDDDQELRRRLNDPANRHLRTKPGKL